jgi:hypothetical protein
MRLGLSPSRSARAGEQGCVVVEGVCGIHACGYVGISSNRWRAQKWPAWVALLGRLRAELANGPKTKFAHLGLLYIFLLRPLYH